MPVSFFLNPKNQIEINYIGDLTFEDNAKMVEGVHNLCMQFLDENRKIDILVDLSQAGKQIDPKSLAFSAKFARDTDFDKVAVFGLNPYLGGLVNTVSTLSGKGDKIQTFKSREEALAWLE